LQFCGSVNAPNAKVGEAERKKEVFRCFNGMQFVFCDQFARRNPRCKAGIGRFVPREKPGFACKTANVSFCQSAFAQRGKHARFPQGTNVNFVQVEADGRIRVRTYERGVENETLACGTGATAAAIVTNFVFQPVTEYFEISVPGGRLSVRFSREPDTPHYTNIRLAGPARRVFAGEFEPENF
jgi:hypothetical protein